jgi:hypothetical protein
MMDENVPTHESGHEYRGRHASASPTLKGKAKQLGLKRIIISVGVIIVVAAAVLAGLSFYRSTTASTIDTTKYQAVFLNSGAVYFGKLEIINTNYMKLTDVYYLQTQAADTANPKPASTSTSTNLELVKLGNELQGPVDEMVINKDQVTFFENLKSDGKVTQAITKDKTNK